MKSAPPHAREKERLEALKSYGVLDSVAEHEFDDAVLLASYICHAPISLVSFVDADRQWFKARVGLEVEETPRNIAFCAHTVSQDAFFVVADAATDPRFADNPLVAGAPGVRFYAAAPIRSAEGLPLGTICVIDRKPRTLEPGQKRALLALGRQIETLLEARRRALEAEARERHLKALELLVRSTNDAYFQVVRGGAIVRANLAAERMYGYSQEELRTMRFQRLEHGPGGAREEISPALERVDRGRFEAVHYRSDGTPLDVELSVSGAGTPEAPHAVVARDISDRVAARREAQFTATMAELMPEAVFVVGVDGKIRHWNRAAEELYGYAADEALGQLSTILLNPPHVREAQTVTALAALQSTGFFRAEVLGMRKDGTSIPIDTATRAVQDSRGDTVFLSINRDLRARKRLEAERKQAEAHLLAAKEAAESASRAKSVFLGNMSHELRTPLHAILGFGRVLAKGHFGPLNELQLRYVHDILESGAHMLDLVEELLELRKLEEGRTRADLSEVEVGAAVAEAARMTHDLAETRGLALTVTPPPGVAERVLSNHRALVQVLINLVSNAIKYTPLGGHVRLSWEAVDGDVAVHVDDDGEGLTEEQQQRLFRDFERLGRTDGRGASGTGLGLALTRRIVESQGGTISVASRPGIGTRFTFTLPRVSPRNDRMVLA